MSSAEFVSPFQPGMPRHGWSFTCLYCKRGEIFSQRHYGSRAVFNDCAQATREAGWTKTRTGWAHKLCVELHKRLLSEKQIQAIVPGPEPLPAPEQLVIARSSAGTGGLSPGPKP
jgi:hypothetical protein